MRSRFFLTLALAVGAGFLIVETQAFGAATAAWLGFAVGIAATIVCAAVLYRSFRRRDAGWLALGGIGLLIAGWNIVASLVFAASTASWLVFANGCGLVAVALAGLVMHELSTERVVHSLEVGEAPPQRRSENRERVAA